MKELTPEEAKSIIENLGIDCGDTEVYLQVMQREKEREGVDSSLEAIVQERIENFEEKCI